jgi:hypothetical protein
MRFSSTPQTHVGVYGGLKDQDRIFTNIYGEHDSSIDGALTRVRHNGTAWKGEGKERKKGNRADARKEI